MSSHLIAWTSKKIMLNTFHSKTAKYIYIIICRLLEEVFISQLYIYLGFNVVLSKKTIYL